MEPHTEVGVAERHVLIVRGRHMGLLTTQGNHSVVRRGDGRHPERKGEEREKKENGSVRKQRRKDEQGKHPLLCV